MAYRYLPRSNTAPRTRVYAFTRSEIDVAVADDLFDELKKVLILAGAFFFITIVCVMSKLQVQAEDVLRWSPVVWLFGVCFAGAVMNLVFYCQKKYKERKRRERTAQMDLLYSLSLPSSFPCLAPPPHVGCCREAPPAALPSYDDVVKNENADELPPPKYSEAVAMLTSISPTSVTIQRPSQS